MLNKNQAQLKKCSMLVTEAVPDALIQGVELIFSQVFLLENRDHRIVDAEDSK